MSLWRGEKVQAFLAEFTDVWLLPARLAGGLWPVIPLIFVQSSVVLCAAGDAGRIETAATALYEGSADRFIAGAAEQGNHQ